MAEASTGAVLDSQPTRVGPGDNRPATIPSEVEPRIARSGWNPGCFTRRPRATASENYSIAIPPPNVTGVLHMGHALPGLDHGHADPPPPHAGAADQVDPRHRPRRHRHPDPGRARSSSRRAPAARSSAASAFEQRVWEWRQEHGGTIIEQLKRLGASCDYAEERFTLDEAYAEAVLKVFVALYEKGYIYRDRYMVNWDPGTGSAISDLEVEQREVTDTLYYIDYPLASGSRRDHRGHRPARDDARRHRDRRAPRRRALPTADRREGDPAARRAQAEDHRRRVREARVRHRRAEDHSRPRPQRLRDRAPARPRPARR